MALASELAARVEAAGQYLDGQVALTAWDDFARDHGETLPPAGGSTDERLDAVLAITTQKCNFRGKLMEELGRPVERWEIDYSDGGWGDRLGLPGIDDPTSEATKRMLQIEDGLGLVRPTALPEGVEPEILLAPACAGPSVAHRIQKTHGLEITPVASDGSFRFERVVDGQAPEALRNPNKLHVSTASFRALDGQRVIRNGVVLPSEVDQVQGFAPDARTEFDLTVAATRLALGGLAIEEEVALPDPGYEFEGRPGTLVTHSIDGVLRAVNIGVPLPTAGERERNRAQTQHSYRALDAALNITAPGLLHSGTQVGVATIPDYAFQLTSAISAALEIGWEPHLVTYGTEESGISRLTEQSQLRLMPEIHSQAMHLTWLRKHIRLLQS